MMGIAGVDVKVACEIDVGIGIASEVDMGIGSGWPPPQKQHETCNWTCLQYAKSSCSYVAHVCTPPPDQAMGSGASEHGVIPLLVPVRVEVIKADLDSSVDVRSNADVVADVGIATEVVEARPDVDVAVADVCGHNVDVEIVGTIVD